MWCIFSSIYNKNNIGSITDIHFSDKNIDKVIMSVNGQLALDRMSSFVMLSEASSIDSLELEINETGKRIKFKYKYQYNKFF